MTGWRLLLTRPADESAALAVQLGAAGVYSSSLPLLEIKPLPVSAPMRTTLHELASFAAVIAVSKPAARLGLALIAEIWPQPPAQAWFSVGDSTGQVLEHSLGQHGLRVWSPAASGDSESLLALPALREAAMQPGARILILRGEGGRGTLGEGLQALGASVTYLELYSRHAPQYPQGALLERVTAERLNALMVSSGQGFQHLLQQLGGAWSQLAHMPLFVPSSRVAALARAAGAMNVVDCRGATAAALLAALRENPAPPSNAKDGYVSETLLPEDKAAPAAVADARDTVATPTSPAPRRGNGLVLLALLVGVAGLAAGGWGVWQIRSIEAHHQLQVSDVKKDLDDATSTLRDENRKLADRLNGLPAAEELENRRRLITQLQGDQQHLSQRLESVLGASRKDWRLAEAEHLLRLASLRLSALQDINSAESLVQGADDILREQDDPSAFAAREQLAKSLQALRGTNQPDRTGLFLQLGALREQVAQLNTLAPVYQDNGEALFGLKGDPDSRLSQWWAHISRYFRIDFDADKSVRPLLAGESLAQVRLALSLALEQAQWAALNGEQAVYTQALKSSREVLDGNFNADNPQGRAIRERIDALGSAPVTVVTPDLAASLSAVQAYLNQRHAPSEALKPGEAGKADGLEAPAP